MKNKRIRNMGIRGIALVMCFSLLLGNTALASEVVVDEETVYSEDAPDVEEANDSAIYSVKWLDVNGNELYFEQRKGNIDDSIYVLEEDTQLEGYIFDSENENNILESTLKEDGSSELIMYFTQQVVQEDILDTETEDVENTNTNVEIEKPNLEVEETGEKQEEVTYLVEWRNLFDELIQSETRNAIKGEEVSVTEEDKSFDSTGRYFINEEATGNKWLGTASDDLVLKMYFDDTQATSMAIYPESEITNYFRFNVDLRPYGGSLKTKVYTNLRPNCSYMSIYDKFDWSELDTYFDYEFKGYSSTEDYTDMAGGTSNYYGTFWGENKNDQLNCRYYFGAKKNDYRTRDITWNVAFNDVTPKVGFRVDTVIEGSYSKTIKGDVVASELDEENSYSLENYIKINKEISSNKDYSYEFSGYRLVDGDGTISGDSYTPGSSFSVVQAVYNVRKYPNLRVDAKLEGSINKSYTGTPLILDWNDNSAYNLEELISCSEIYDTDLYDVTFKGYSLVSGEGNFVGDNLSLDCSFNPDETQCVVEALFQVKSKSSVTVICDVEGDDTLNETTKTVFCEPNSDEFVCLQSMFSSKLVSALNWQKDYTITFSGYELESGNGTFTDSNDIACLFNPDNEECVIRAKFVKTNTPGPNSIENQVVLNFKISGDVPDILYTQKFNPGSWGAYSKYTVNINQYYTNMQNYLESLGYSISNNDYSYSVGTATSGRSNHVSFREINYNKDLRVETLSNSWGPYYLEVIIPVTVKEKSNVNYSVQLSGDIEDVYNIKQNYVTTPNTTLDLRKYSVDFFNKNIVEGKSYIFDGYYIETNSGTSVEKDINYNYSLVKGDNNIVAKYIVQSDCEDKTAMLSVDIVFGNYGNNVRRNVLDSVLVNTTDEIDLKDYISEEVYEYLSDWNYDVGYEIESGKGTIEGSIYKDFTEGSINRAKICFDLRPIKGKKYIVPRTAIDGMALPSALCSDSNTFYIPESWNLGNNGFYGSFLGWTDDTALYKPYAKPPSSSWNNLLITDYECDFETSKDITYVYPVWKYDSSAMDKILVQRDLYVDYGTRTDNVYTDPSRMLIIGESNVEAYPVNTPVYFHKSSLSGNLPDKDLYDYSFKEWRASSVSGSDDNRDKTALYISNSTDFIGGCLNYLRLRTDRVVTGTVSEVYTAIPKKNRFKLNTVIIGDKEETILGDYQVLDFGDDSAINLSNFVNKDKMKEDDSYSYEFDSYRVVQGSGSFIQESGENSIYSIGSPVDGYCHIEARYVAVKKPVLSYVTLGGTDVKPTYADNNTFMVTRRVPVKEGYTFKGWSLTEDAVDVDYIGGDILGASEDRVLYAVWVKDSENPSNPGDSNTPSKKYTLTYETGVDFGIDSQESTNAQFIVTRRTPTKEGYTFAGWSTTENPQTSSEVDYIGGDIVPATKDITLYAVFVKNKVVERHTLSYDTVGGSEIKPTEPDGGFYMVTRRIPVKSGYTFVGWSTEANTTTIDYIAGDKISALSDITLYAVWLKNEVPVTFSLYYNTMGGTEVEPTESIDGKFMVTRRTPVKEGKVFLGWSTKADDTDIDYIAGDFILANANKQLYAVWVDATDSNPEDVKTYALSYDTKGGTTIEGTKSYNNMFFVTRNTPVKEGYTFIGWSLKDTEDTNLVDYIGGDLFVATKNTTLYAIYTPIKEPTPEVPDEIYTITYDSRGGSYVKPTNSVDGMFTVTRNTPELYNKIFAGWSISKDSTSVKDIDYVGGDTFKAEGNITLYALYKDVEIGSVNVNTNGGSNVETNVTVVNNKYIIQITIPEKPGYTFPGWDIDGDGEPDVTPDTTIETDDPTISIEAVWNLKKIPLQYVVASDSVWEHNMEFDSVSNELFQSVYTVDDSLYDLEGRAGVKINTVVPSREGYTFKGWSLGNILLSEDILLYAPGDTLYLDELDSLYESGMRFTAVWEPEEEEPNTDGNGTDNNPENPEEKPGDSTDIEKPNTDGNGTDNNPENPEEKPGDSTDIEKPGVEGNNKPNTPNTNKPSNIPTGKNHGTVGIRKPRVISKGTKPLVASGSRRKSPITGDFSDSSTIPASIILLGMGIILVVIRKREA